MGPADRGSTRRNAPMQTRGDRPAAVLGPNLGDGEAARFAAALDAAAPTRIHRPRPPPTPGPALPARSLERCARGRSRRVPPRPRGEPLLLGPLSDAPAPGPRVAPSAST